MNTLDSQDAMRSVEASRIALNAAVADADHVDLSWLGDAIPENSWSLAPDAVRLVCSLVRRIGPQHILEFGAGLSTRILAEACEDLVHSCCITSIDNDPDVIEGVGKIFNQRPRRCTLSCQLSPLVLRKFDGRLLSAYYLQPQRFSSRLPVDLVLIDGPSEKFGGREATFYQVFPFLRPGSIVLVDDAHRDSEASALLRWRDRFGDAVDIDLLPGFTKGLAAVIVKHTRVELKKSALEPEGVDPRRQLVQNSETLKKKENQLTILRARLLKSLTREKQHRAVQKESERSFVAREKEHHASVKRLDRVVEELRTQVLELQNAMSGVVASCKIGRILSSLVSPGERVFVVSKGDERLLTLCGSYEGGHFPCSPDGSYIGYHPESSIAAINNVKQLRQAGGLILVFPESAFWWRDYYLEFFDYLNEECARIVTNDACIVFRVH